MPPTGLANVGNTCYFNATLQVMYHCHAFVSCLIRHCDEGTFTRDMCRLLYDMWAADKNGLGSVSPFYVIQQIAEKTRFKAFEQNDAHELYCIMLDAMLADMNGNTVSHGTPSHPPPPSHNPHHPHNPHPPSTADESEWHEHFARHGGDGRSDFAKAMHGQMRCAVTCDACRRTTYRYEVFNSLSVDCTSARGDGMTIGELIFAAFEPERIADFYCDACRVRGYADRRMHLWRLPSVVVVSVNRFTIDGISVARTHVELTKKLDPILETISARNSPASRLLLSNADARVAFKVIGAVCHIGSQVSGHYYATVRDLRTGDWFVIDDLDVRQIEKRTVPPRAAYLVVYERVRLKARSN